MSGRSSCLTFYITFRLLDAFGMGGGGRGVAEIY